METIGDIARLNAKRYPDKIALTMGGEHVTYQRMNQQVNQLAHGLLAMGVEPGDRVALLASNCLEYPVINFAASKCGAVFVPVNFRFKKEELVYVINNSTPKVLFFGPEFLSLVEEARGEFSSPLQLTAISGGLPERGFAYANLMEGKPTVEPNARVDPDAPCAIMYTSGTTGFPKGVLFSHTAYLGTYTGLVLEGDLGHEDVTLVSLPLFHNGGLNALLMPTLMVGGQAVVMDTGFDPERILSTVAEQRATLTLWVPTMLAMLINHPTAQKYELSSLRKIWYGSSVISTTVLQAAMDLFQTRFYQFYGLTETGMVSVLRPEDHRERSQCTGREMFNAELRIVDEQGRDIRQGEVGEIICAGRPLGMIGYHGMEEATAQTIRDGWIYTGDLARVEGDGYFTVVDRKKDMIISGAENIYPKEVEDVISGHPGVREVAVIGIPDDVYGESVCAVVVRKEGMVVEAQEIIDFCVNRISGYKKPKRVDFMDDFPKTSMGKVMKRVLREPYWAGAGKNV